MRCLLTNLAKCRNRPRPSNKKGTGFYSPLDVAWKTVMLLDLEDEIGEFEDLLLGEGVFPKCPLNGIHIIVLATHYHRRPHAEAL